MFWKSLFTGHPRRVIWQLRSWLSLRYPKGPLRLHLGCGQSRLNGFVNIDCNYSAATDYVGDASKLPCPDGSAERIETYHVIEHIPLPIVRSVLTEWRRVLAVGGRLVIECPDLDQAARDYLSGNHECLFSIYGRQRFPGDAHYWGYTPLSLRQLLEKVGFSEVVAAQPQDYHKESEPCLRIECTKR
jgi:predicted SAM-dependent methyltransferase